MGQVHDIAERKPHTAGLARCGGCGHEWMAVCPTGVLAMECPECGQMKGVRKEFICASDGTPTFRCYNCAEEDPDGKMVYNDVFSLAPHYVMCCNCGFRHEWEQVMPGDGW